MIFSETLQGNQMECRRWSCSTPSKVIQTPKEDETIDVCLCSYSNTSCEYYELAFTSFDTTPDISNSYENDYRKFLINPLSLTSGFNFTLIDSAGVEYVIYSDSQSTTDYGEVYEQGFNVDQPIQVGVKIDWYKVAMNIGYGDYTVKLSQTDFGTTVSRISHMFRVVKFNPNRANGTIKIEVNNVGVTMNGENWTGLFSSNDPYVNMIRVRGRLDLTDPDIETESIEDGRREDIPVQTKVTDTYSIAIDKIPFDLGKGLVSESIVMNWSLTDYNIFNNNLRDVEMIVNSSSVKNTPDYIFKSYELTGKSNISKLNRKFV